MSQSPLFEVLRNTIAMNGPLSVGAYMSLCLGHPQHGYYMSQEAFGARGDFITAPEISQLFGEMIAVWVITTWESMGRPTEMQLVELGPGRGTLIKDVWRALKVLPELQDILTVQLVEFSPRLQKIQQDNLSGLPVIWHTRLDTLANMPSLIIANEFFDALPVEQAVLTHGQWHQRMITVTDGRLAFATGPALQGIPTDGATDGALFEYAPVAMDVMQEICAFLNGNTGTLLAIDYGDDVPVPERFGDTVQALQDHRPIDILAAPGTSDITAHVSFSALQALALENDCRTLPIQTQREFLTQLGIRLRADRLAAGATQEQAEAILTGLHRLVDPAEMGDLFKVLQVYSRDA